MGGRSMDVLSLTNGELHYEVAGSGESLLLLHAGVADSRMWDPQFSPLAQRCRVVRCDLRGHGRSLLPDGPFAWHEDTHELLQALGMAPAWIVGASLGARVAVDHALAYPEEVGGLVLVSPVVGGFRPEGAVAEFGDEEDRLLDDGRLDEATELNVRMWVDGPARPPDAVDSSVRRLVGQMQLQIFSLPTPENVSLRPLEPPAIERLAEIDCPVLVVSGELDVPEFRALALRLAEDIPEARLLEVPGVAHMVSMEKPATFLDAVLECFSSAGGSLPPTR